MYGNYFQLEINCVNMSLESRINMCRFTAEDLEVFVDSMDAIHIAESLKNKSSEEVRKRHRVLYGFYDNISQRSSQLHYESIISSILEQDSEEKEQLPTKYEGDSSCIHSSSFSSQNTCDSSGSEDLPPLQRPRTFAFSKISDIQVAPIKRKAKDHSHVEYLTTMCRSISPIPSSDDGYSSTPPPMQEFISPISRPRSFAITKNINGRMTRARIIGSILKREYAEAGSQSDVEVAERSERVVNWMKQSFDSSCHEKYGKTGLSGVDPYVLEKALQYLTLSFYFNVVFILII